jgi:hypothetical protein
MVSRSAVSVRGGPDFTATRLRFPWVFWLREPGRRLARRGAEAARRPAGCAGFALAELDGAQNNGVITQVR